MFSLLWISCENKTVNNKETPVEIVASPEESFALDTFSKLPPEIDGCACYFSNDKTEFGARKYIYADDFGKNAFVSINGEMKKFVLTTSETLPGDRTVKTFENLNYTITIDFKQVGQVDETWQQAGTIKISPKVGKATITNIYGECGC